MLNEFYDLSHEITPQTLAVIAQVDDYGNLSTCVLEEESEYVIDYSPSKLIDYSCKFFGSSLKGRQDGTRDICGITHKAPISIDPSSGMYFFPTSSPTSPKCSWIAHSHIKELNKADSNCTEIIFKNGKKVILDASFGSVINQVQRTAQFRYLLDNRIRYLMQRKSDPAVEPST